MMNLFDKIPLLKRICKSRWLQFIIVFPTLVIFIVFLYAGIYGTPVGNRNIIVVFVWILWWVILIGLMVPFGSRIWCLICPFPIIGEWLQRRSFVRVRAGNNTPGLKSQYSGCNKPWPKKRRHIWLQNFGFLCLATFSPFLVTRPFVSFLVLGGLFGVATVMGMIYKQRVFCMYICPVSGFLSLYAMTSKLAMRAKDVELCNRIKEGHEDEFNFDNGLSACRLSCPTGIDASSYVALIGKGMYSEALEVIREATPFAGVLGRVCTHPCETECVRGDVDEPISICRLKRFVADYGGYDGMKPEQEFTPLHDEKVAVIGSGPTGLSCAYQLARKGYEATIYESLPVAGGMLKVGIPNFHLPENIVDKEIEFVKNSGVKILTDTAVGRDITFEELQKEYQSIFISVGASKARRLRIEGEDMQGVYMGVDFLRMVKFGEKVNVGGKVVVVGGGKTAEDVARTALRLGASDAVCVEIRSQEEMPGPMAEVAEAEGVRVFYSTSLIKITGHDDTGNSVLCIKMISLGPDETGKLRFKAIDGSEFLIHADTIIIATGQYSDIDFLPEGLDISKAGTIIVDPEFMETNIPGVFAGGDVVSGPDVLVKSLGAGRKAALSIDRYLRDEHPTHISFYPSEQRVEEVPIAVIHREERLEPPERPIAGRLEDFDEVEYAFTENMAVEEAKRCLSCGICGECYRGTDKSWACAWFQKMGGMDRNNYCGLCMECVKSCPHDNIGLNWRPFAADKDIKGLDESWKALIMMVLAVIYPINLLSPWGKIRDWLSFMETGMIGNFAMLSVNMYLWTLVLFPFVHYLFCKAGKSFSGVEDVSVKKLFMKYSYAYVPLGLMAWICFSIPLLLISGAYIAAVISDPFGWGWDLLGTVHVQWSPIIPNLVPYMQAPLLLIGFFYSIVSVYKISRRIFEKKAEAVKSIVPVIVLLSLVMIVLLRLYLG